MEGLISEYSMPGCIQSGTGFPDGRCLGNRVPEFAFGMGQTFRNPPHRENVSRNEPPEWDALSARALNGKRHPRIQAQSGTHFPNALPTGNYVPFRRQIPGCGFRDAHVRPRICYEAMAGGRRVTSVASSARKEGHLMWPSSCAGLSEQQMLPCARPPSFGTARAGNLTFRAARADEPG